MRRTDLIFSCGHSMWIIAAVLSVASGAAMSDPKGPLIGAASNFSQGRTSTTLPFTQAIGVTDLRDGSAWSRIETTPGIYDFSDSRAIFGDDLQEAGIGFSAVVNWGNPLYDDGRTPTSAQGIAAFGNFAAALAARFPALHSIEVGNEFNGVNFVNGPIRNMAPLERAAAYVPLLKATAEAVRKVRPDVRILGGATHSIPVQYIGTILDAGGADYMDALAIHPYTTPAEQLVRQINVLRQHPKAANLDIEVTEFGIKGADLAPGHFLRNYCQMALAGISRTTWYPLNARGDGFEPLFDAEGQATPVARAIQFAQAHFEGQPVSAFRPDPFTYGCRFGNEYLVLWGEPRNVVPRAGAQVFDPTGAVVAGPYSLSPDTPYIVHRARGSVLRGARLKGQSLVADSFHQFEYPTGTESRAGTDPFARFARRGTEIIPLPTLPGQEASGTPWFPYRGSVLHRPMRLTAETLVPGRSGSGPIEIVHQLVVPDSGRFDLRVDLDVPDRSEDGISLTLMRNDTVLQTMTVEGTRDVWLRAITFEAGDVLDVSVGPNGTTQGDAVTYRIRLYES
ncbi:hypothetical protein [Roseobacter sp.]|uniref:hypothetical protein n=1 Tax=Roseobacter sp. TaxID=1907202 RepID=UPI00329A568C